MDKSNELREKIEALTDEQRQTLINKLRPAAIRQMLQNEKGDNWKKYSNRPK